MREFAYTLISVYVERIFLILILESIWKPPLKPQVMWKGIIIFEDVLKVINEGFGTRFYQAARCNYSFYFQDKKDENSVTMHLATIS